MAPMAASFGVRLAVVAGLFLLAAGRPGAQTAAGPPANLDGGPFRGTIDHMWRDSPSFRQQCQRIAAEPHLTVTIRADTNRRNHDVRARTRLARKRPSGMTAEIILFNFEQKVELIAHELEHVIELLDGALGRDNGCLGTKMARSARESCRAVEMGRRVAREVLDGPVTQAPADEREAIGTSLGTLSARVSANGRFVALTSRARLTSNDTDDDVDVYVQDLGTGALTLETARDGWAGSFHQFADPGISANGRILIVRALPKGPHSATGGRWRVVVLDRRSGEHRVIAFDPDGAGAKWDHAMAVLSADGSTLVVQSSVWALDGGSGISEIHLVRLQTGEIEPVSVASGGASPAASYTPAVNADGRYVAFMSTGDLTCGAACAGQERDGNGHADVYLRDTVVRKTHRVSRRPGGGDANGGSSWPSISADGRHVAFTSDASNLVEGDTNGLPDVFVYDAHDGVIELVSHRPDGKTANGASQSAVISGDGRSVAFESTASDLVCAKRCAKADRDINLVWDVFLYNRAERRTTRASRDEAGGWMEPSQEPGVDHAGGVVIFTSRHPAGAGNGTDDRNLYVWTPGRGPLAAGTRARR